MPMAPEALCGRIVGDHWRVESVLGVGGMAVVYRAVDVNSGSPAALKVLNVRKLSGRPDRRAQALRRFRREAEDAGRLRHPNTVRVYHCGVADEGYLYIVMELLEGTSLRELIDRSAPLPAERVVHIATQILGSLAEAHDQGLVHRDLKPENVMLTHARGAPDFVKVVDFGIALRLGEPEHRLTELGQLVGTPRYVAPERLTGEEGDGRSDLYALGILLFELLTGDYPYELHSAGQRAGRREVLAAHQIGTPRAIERLRPHVSPVLAQVIRQLMARSPSERYARAVDALEALDLARREPAMAVTWHRDTDEQPPLQPIALDARTERQHRVVMAGVVVLGLALCLLLVVALRADPVPVSPLPRTDLTPASAQPIATAARAGATATLAALDRRAPAVEVRRDRAAQTLSPPVAPRAAPRPTPPTARRTARRPTPPTGRRPPRAARESTGPKGKLWFD